MVRPKDGQYFITFRTLADGQLEATYPSEVRQYLEHVEAVGGIKALDEIDGIIDNKDLPYDRAMSRVCIRTISMRSKLEDKL